MDVSGTDQEGIEDNLGIIFHINFLHKNIGTH